MVASSPDPRPTAKGGLIPPEWSAQAADTVIDTVAKVRDRTTRPAQLAARGVVYGLVIAVIGGTAGVLLLILLVRMLSNWLPGDVWTVYAVLAVVFTVLGLFCLRRASRIRPSS